MSIGGIQGVRVGVKRACLCVLGYFLLVGILISMFNQLIYVIYHL